MSDTYHATKTPAPIRLWVIGILGTVWKAMGAMDYVMTLSRNKTYMSGFSPQQPAFFMTCRTGLLRSGVGCWGRS